MSDYDEIIDGITILKRYVKTAEQHTAAEHDIIFFGGGGEAISPVDAAKLDDLGFFIESDSGSWAKFT